MIQRLQVKRNEKGFTLIELLIVIIVLGILAAIVVFAVASTRKDAVASSCKTDLKSMELSASAVATKMGNPPATDAGLLEGANGGLLKELPPTTEYTLTYTPLPAAGPPYTDFKVSVSGSSGHLTEGDGIAGCVAS